MEKKVRQSEFNHFRDYILRVQEETNDEFLKAKAEAHGRYHDSIMSLEKRIDKLNETIAEQEEKINDLKNALNNERVAINNPPKYRSGNVVAGYRILSVEHKPASSLLPYSMTLIETTSWTYRVKDKNGVVSKISEPDIEFILREEKKKNKK